MRIVGGRLRGRALAAPKSQAIRPTADRLREALFNVLVHDYGDPVTGARVLDLFAGTGAIGIEALSRGASFALFVADGADADVVPLVEDPKDVPSDPPESHDAYVHCHAGCGCLLCGSYGRTVLGSFVLLSMTAA